MKYAEINKETNTVAAFGEAPFIPQFAPGHPTFCVDITGIEPPQSGYIYNPESGTFEPPPPPVEADPYAGYLGDLILETATGGQFSADNAEINVRVGQAVTVTGSIRIDGQILTHIDPNTPFTVSELRLPLLQADLHGNPLDGTQPSMAIASITEGIVTATWVPELTGTYVITEDGVNVRLSEGQKFKFDGLHIFVLPGIAL